LFHGFSYIGERSEVDTRFDLVFSRNTFKQRAIAYSVAIEMHICIQSRVMAAGQIVQNNECLPAFPQQFDSYASDVPAPPVTRIATAFLALSGSCRAIKKLSRVDRLGAYA
jgi:hypothetical protein